MAGPLDWLKPPDLAHGSAGASEAGVVDGVFEFLVRDGAAQEGDQCFVVGAASQRNTARAAPHP